MRFLSGIASIGKMILVPLISVILLNAANIFDFVTFIPENYRFECGLIVYLAVCEAGWDFLKRKLSSRCANIDCIFYVHKEEKSIDNTPTIICGPSSTNVASLKCEIRLEGCANTLRNTHLRLLLPEWLSTQVSSSNLVLKYSDNILIWEFDKIIQDSEKKEVLIMHTVDIPFIQNADNVEIVQTLFPEIEAKWTDKFIVSFKTNKFNISNREIV